MLCVQRCIYSFTLILCLFYIIQPPRCWDKGQSDANKHSCIVQMVLWLGFDKDRSEFSKMVHNQFKKCSIIIFKNSICFFMLTR